MDPLAACTVLLFLIFLGVLVMGAAILTLLTTVKAQLAALLANSINATDAAAIQAGVQDISDTLTGAGAPPAP